MGISESLAFRNNGLPRFKPMSNGTPFTYGDGSTYLSILNALEKFITGELVPDIQERLNDFVSELNKAVSDIEEGMAVDRETLDAVYEKFTAAVRSEVSYINNKTGPHETVRETLTDNSYVVEASPLWPTNHPVYFILTQDEVGEHSVSLGSNIVGEVDISKSPGEVAAQFWLIPGEDNQWVVYQPESGVTDSVNDRAVTKLLQNLDSTSSEALIDRVEGVMVPAIGEAKAAVAKKTYDDLLDFSSALYSAVTEISRTVKAELFPGKLKAWGDALQNKTREPAIWVALGSSTTDAFGLPKAYGYVGRIAAFITRKSSTTGFVSLLADVVNRPANGVHVYEGVAIDSAIYLSDTKLAAIQKLKPTLITHMIGSNDYMVQNSVNNYITNIRNAYNRIKAVSPNTVHVYIHQQQRNDVSNNLIPWSTYGSGLKEFAREVGAVFLDLSTEVFNGERSIYPAMMSGDNAHMNSAGQAHIARHIARALGTPLPEPGTELVKIPFNSALNTIPVNVSTTVAEGVIKAAPYARIVDVSLTMMGYGKAPEGTAGAEAGLVAEYTDDNSRTGPQTRLRYLNGGIGYALTNNGHLRFEMEPNRDVRIWVVWHNPAGESVVDATSGAYSKLEAIITAQ